MTTTLLQFKSAHFIVDSGGKRWLRTSFSTVNRYFISVGPKGAAGALHMIDLSPQPQDQSSSTTELNPVARHDPPGGRFDSKLPVSSSRWMFPHERAELLIQWFSRWAGPAALLVTLAAIGWFLFT